MGIGDPLGPAGRDKQLLDLLMEIKERVKGGPFDEVVEMKLGVTCHLGFEDANIPRDVNGLLQILAHHAVEQLQVQLGLGDGNDEGRAQEQIVTLIDGIEEIDRSFDESTADFLEIEHRKREISDMIKDASDVEHAASVDNGHADTGLTREDCDDLATRIVRKIG